MVLRAGFLKKLRLYVELKIYDKNRRKNTGPQCVKIEFMLNIYNPPSETCNNGFPMLTTRNKGTAYPVSP
jgi:hypothetical protein